MRFGFDWFVGFGDLAWCLVLGFLVYLVFCVSIRAGSFRFIWLCWFVLVLDVLLCLIDLVVSFVLLFVCLSLGLVFGLLMIGCCGLRVMIVCLLVTWL